MSDGRYIGEIEVDYHRNGVSGESFWTCRFTFEEDNGPEAFVAVLPVLGEDEDVGAPAYEWGHCYVLRVRDLIDGEGMNHWRGDYFELDLRAAILRAESIWFDHTDNKWTPMPIRVPAYEYASADA